MENQIVIQNAEDYEKRGSKALDAVMAVNVTDEATLQTMGDLLSRVKQGMKTIEARINEPIEKAHELHRWLTGLRSKILTPWKSAESVAKQRMADYQYGLMVAKREAERKAEEERRRLEEKQAAEANKAMKKNQPEKAEAILAKPVEPKTIVPEVPKTEKQSVRFVYSFVVEDVEKIPRQYMIPNATLINKVVQAEKMACSIPGVKVIESAGVRSR